MSDYLYSFVGSPQSYTEDLKKILKELNNAKDKILFIKDNYDRIHYCIEYADNVFVFTNKEVPFYEDSLEYSTQNLFIIDYLYDNYENWHEIQLINLWKKKLKDNSKKNKKGYTEYLKIMRNRQKIQQTFEKLNEKCRIKHPPPNQSRRDMDKIQHYWNFDKNKCDSIHVIDDIPYIVDEYIDQQPMLAAREAIELGRL